MTTRRLQCVFVCLMAGLLTACTSLRPLHQPGEHDKLRTQLRQGDRVEVVTHEGWRINFRVAEVGDSALTGTAAQGKGVEVPYDRITKIKVRRFSLWKTTLLSFGLVEVAVIGLVALSPPALLP